MISYHFVARMAKVKACSSGRVDPVAIVLQEHPDHILRSLLIKAATATMLKLADQPAAMVPGDCTLVMIATLTVFGTGKEPSLIGLHICQQDARADPMLVQRWAVESAEALAASIVKQVGA